MRDNATRIDRRPAATSASRQAPQAAVPTPARLAAAGLAAITVLVLGAAALRAPIVDEDDDDTAVTADPSASARVASPKRTADQPAGTTTAPGKTTAPALKVTAAPPPTAGAAELRGKLRDEVEKRQLKSATATLGQLLEVDADAPRSNDVRGDIVELSMRVMLIEGPEPGQVFDLITHHMGTTGPDILYELLTTRGGSRAAAKAEELLKDPAVRELGTPAMRIAYDLRVAHGCEEKIALFDRAKTDGDGRTLGQLQLLNRRCGRRSGSDCCLQNDPALRAAMDAIKQR